MKIPFESFGVMLDMSRNAVMNLEQLKNFMVLLRKMGYNSIMLYTEDTYEVDGEPYFGYLRGRYSKAEMKEIDSYGQMIGMEVIPCIQTLAHLNAIFRWRQVRRDCNDILLVDDDRTYELIGHMFSTLSECFSSRKIHVGMDEAYMLGRGRHQDIHGPESVISIMKRHLAKVCEIGEKYGYEIMVWSDMFFTSWNKGEYWISKSEVPKEVVESIPSNVTPVYWDYFHETEQAYVGMIENHKQLSNNTCFAGAAWSWQGIIPYNRYTVDVMRPAVDACKKQGVQSFYLTMWGDDGAECSRFSLLPSLFYLAEYARGNTDEADIKRKFKQFSGIDYDDFIQIDSPNDILPYQGMPKNPSKYMLYSDYFNGFLDYTILPEAGEKYIGYAEKLHEIAKKSRRFGHLFKSAALLSDVLAIKYTLGYRTREAYEAGDKATLRLLAENEYLQVAKRIKAFLRAFEKQWMIENKPHGFDVQDLRLGGLLQRTDACRRRLLDYVNGKIERIDELEEKLLPYKEKGTSVQYNRAPTNATVNMIHMSHIY